MRKFKRVLECVSALALTLSVHGAALGQPVINEFVFNHTGTDFNEYVEIYGPPNTDFFNVWVLAVEGDGGGAGEIDAAIRFGTTDPRGLRTTLYQTNQFENGTQTLLLVENFTGAAGDDLDTNNDGTLDTQPWSNLLDSVAVTDGDAGDTVYSTVVLEPDFDGGIFPVGGASRTPNGVDTDTTVDWVRNDFDNEGVPGFNGTLEPGEALNTPGDLNALKYASGGGSAPPGLRISDIQGTRHRSPYEGQAVSGVQGIVTAIDNSPSFAQGFYMQSVSPDGDAKTSEGIFVLTAAAPAVSVGDQVTVEGVVEENRPASNVENLTITRIRSIVVGQVVVSGSSTPVATIIGTGGLQPPRTIISSFNGHIEDRPSLRLTEGLDFWESLEGMYLQIKDPLAVTSTRNFNELWVVADNGEKATGINSRDGITIRRFDFNPERIQIDDGILFGATSGVGHGDKLTDIFGVLSYDFENFEIDAVAQVVVETPAGLTPETTTLTGLDQPNSLKVATFNVLNLDPGDGSQFNGLAAIIANNLKSPDIVALEEMQDNDGETDSGTVAADVTFQTLVNAIAAAGGPAYNFLQIDPVNNEDGGAPGSNIRVGFLYNPARVSLGPGAPGNATTNTTVVPGPALSHNPGRLLDTNFADGDAFVESRKPLAAHFVFKGRNIFVVANHFNSKGGDQPLFGPAQPPTLISEPQRIRQAQIVNDFVDALQAVDRGANVIVLGDLNDFQFSPPLQTLKGQLFRQALLNLGNTLPNREQYSFIFDGNSQALDTILASPLLALYGGVDYVHANIEFPVAASDHDPVMSRFNFDAGDLNGDGRVTLTDVSRLRRLLGSSGHDNPNADIDGDGKVDVGDLARQLLLLFGGQMQETADDSE